jgi:hypothetical protein
MVDVDTFLTTVYVVVDEYDKAQGQAQPARLPTRQRGCAPALSRSEVVTLAIFGQWAQFRSERAFYRFAERHLRAAFPSLPARSQFNRQLRTVAVHAIVVAVGQRLADELCRAAGGCAYEVLDSTGIPTRNSDRRGHGWLEGQADRGWCTRLGWYVGLHLLTVVTPAGVLTGYGCAPAASADVRLADTLLAVRQWPQAALPEVGQTWGAGYYVADTSFEGQRWLPRWRVAYGAYVLCPPKRHQPFPQPWPRTVRRQHAGLREIVESVHDRLLHTFRLAHERPHTLAGFRARLAATVTLHNVCCWLNHHRGRPTLAFADLLDW